MVGQAAPKHAGPAERSVLSAILQVADGAPVPRGTNTVGLGQPVESVADTLRRARGFAESLLAGHVLDTGEPAFDHADAVSRILVDIGAGPSMSTAAYLVYAGERLADPEDVVRKSFGVSYATLVSHTRRLVKAQVNARDGWQEQVDAEALAVQLERVRKMLLAFSQDLRVVLLRLTSRLQTLRYHARTKEPCPPALAQESLKVFAPLANRLGIWQIKWEMEDLAFRFLHPEDYHRIARALQEKRTEREATVAADRTLLAQTLADVGITAEVMGRPKHIYSIWRKMQGKGLPFERVFDVRALRVLVADVPDCYAALSRVHELWRPKPEEFDDYIARPKSNGYQSLHTIVEDAQGRPLEVQIRTRTMHEHAESGVAAHWAYKEAGTKGYAGVVAAGPFEEQVAQARRAVLEQLLAWERDVEVETAADSARVVGGGPRLFEDRIYVFTPQARLIELTGGATPVDFAYALHTDVGHRCRGAKVDGVMVPTNTPLRSGQTVEILCAKEGGPSLDWLNPALGYVQSQRSRAKVRAWFNAQQQQETIARGREAVEKVLQREGQTALKLEELAARLGFRQADALFELVGKDEFSLRNIEQVLRPQEPVVEAEVPIVKRPRASDKAGSGVLVVGVGSLMTQLARCCRPAPPDVIVGYVTRGKGVAVHRADCVSFKQMTVMHEERVIPVAWDGRDAAEASTSLYPMDVIVLAQDRQGLLRDISDVFAKERINVVGVKTQSLRGEARMVFTVEARNGARLQAALQVLSQVPGVDSARRR